MKLLYFLFFFTSSISFSQENDIFSRLSAMLNGGKVWYNIDGYSVTSEDFGYPFGETGLNIV